MKPIIIDSVNAIEVLDSRGNPTIEVSIALHPVHHDTSEWYSGYGRAIVPSGASTGIHEALELRDGDKSRYLGKWVQKAVNNVNKTISDAIVGQTYSSVRELDQALIALDGTPNKSKLGANAILGVSMAYCVAVANMQWVRLYEYLAEQNCKGKGTTLPIPLMNIINGGSHADNNLDIQEFMIVPVWASSLTEAVRMGAEIFHHLKAILKKMSMVTAVGDEWGFAPNLDNNEHALQVIIQAIEAAGYTTNQIKLALDVASSEFYRDGGYHMEAEGKVLTSTQLVDYYSDLVSRYPIISIEDGCAEDDFAGRAELTTRLWDQIMTVGDDLYVTNITRLQMGIDQQLANAILIKLNQIGSVSETLDAINLAHDHGMRSITSHRSGETEDSFIADLAVATNSGYIKTGSLSRTDRIAKYNQLIRIEHNLWDQAQYGRK